MATRLMLAESLMLHLVPTKRSLEMAGNLRLSAAISAPQAVTSAVANITMAEPIVFLAKVRRTCLAAGLIMFKNSGC
jgi:hypothetical protein